LARIAGIDIPRNKRIIIALTYIYGIGRTRASEILATCGINEDTKVKDLTDNEVASIRKYIEEHFKVEGSLRAEVSSNIKRLIAINCYRGLRHKRGLPVHGQRTRDNARTRKGPRKTVGRKSKK
jgi:small subunit ribosomal protein S13